MILQVYRQYKKDSYTIGKLYINGEYFCDTLEDKDRGLNQNMPLSYLRDHKVYGKTAIPTGDYKITLEVISPKFGSMPFYDNTCQGKLPRLLDVPAFDGVLIHVADGYKGAELLQGCIGVGKNKIKGGLLEGKETFTELYKRMEEAQTKEEELNLNIG